MTTAKKKKLNKSESKGSKHERIFVDPHELLVQLCQKYPNVLSPLPQNIKPLKLRIDKDIRDEMKVSQKAAYLALRIYTKQTAYIAKVAEGGARYDLSGKKVEAKRREKNFRLKVPQKNLDVINISFSNS